MRALIQRVSKGSVIIDGKIYSSIHHGFVILLGIFKTDSEEDINVLVPKIVNLRIMSDERGKMNKSIVDINGEILVVSQFTLCADSTKGRRPSFIYAMEPILAEKLYNTFVEKLQISKLTIKTGKFGAMMEVEIINDGPVTILLDSKTL